MAKTYDLGLVVLASDCGAVGGLACRLAAGNLPGDGALCHSDHSCEEPHACTHRLSHTGADRLSGVVAGRAMGAIGLAPLGATGWNQRQGFGRLLFPGENPIVGTLELRTALHTCLAPANLLLSAGGRPSLWCCVCSHVTRTGAGMSRGALFRNASFTAAYGRENDGTGNYERNRQRRRCGDRLGAAGPGCPAEPKVGGLAVPSPQLPLSYTFRYSG